MSQLTHDHTLSLKIYSPKSRNESCNNIFLSLVTYVTSKHPTEVSNDAAMSEEWDKDEVFNLGMSDFTEA